MQLLLQCILLIAGFVALVKGADLFVDGSSALAKNFKVPEIIIGLTIVALGTSAPELAVSTSAALKGANEIALSNVIGSNLFNVLCVLGICALVNPLTIDNTILKRDFPISIGACCLTFAGAFLPFLLSGKAGSASFSDNVGSVSRLLGLVLLVLFIAYIAMLIVSARKNATQEEGNIALRPLWQCFLLIVVGLALIVLGGQFVVNSAKTIAATFGMSETLIGLTIVAVGTSLPELVTSMVATHKGQRGIAAGNVVGSNIFNFLFILGVSGSIHPIAANFASLVDLAILIVVSVVAYFFARTKDINRIEGSILVLFYIATIVFAVVR